MAYAALVCVMHTLEEIQLSARYQTIHDKDLIGSLRENIIFLQEFLEDYSQKRSKEIKSLESQIRDSTYVAADYIEYYMVQCSQASSTAERDEISADFRRDLLQVDEELDSIKKEAMKNIEENTVMKYREPKHSKGAASSRSDNFHSGNDIVVGFEDHLTQIMDALTGPESSLQIFPIVGMGGIGKTTLARSIYENGFIVEHFDVRAWFAVSQEYDAREIILSLLHDITISVDQKTQESDERQETGQDLEPLFDLKAFINKMMRMTDYEIGERLYKNLWGRRYFIVLDDMWSSEAWSEIRKFFPDNNNGSRVMVTTRLSNVAEHFCSPGHEPFELTFLDFDKSWELLCKHVFGQEDCPCELEELEEVGKMMVHNCKGLPLAIKVVAGLLSKSNRNRESWEFIAEDMNSIINYENDEYCFKILYLSYSHLPIHLKPCFLYMGVFPEDSHISVSKLIKLWVAEGFLKPIKPKSLEEVAAEYLKDLIDRNLVLVSRTGFCGEMKGCSLHDLLRDLCLREAEKENFFSASISPGSESVRRLIIHQQPWDSSFYQDDDASEVEPAFLCCSLICSTKQFPVQVTRRLRLLRVLDAVHDFSVQDILELVNSRYLSFKVNHNLSNMFLSSISQFHNLETLIIETSTSQLTLLPYEIWEMPQLKHLKFRAVCLPDPADAQIRSQSSCVLENLQTLSCVWNLRCTEDVVERIPNVRKLRLVCPDASTYDWSYYCLNNLAHLHILEVLKLTCVLNDKIYPGELDFPSSLRKLTLSGCKFPWEDMTIIGSLPNLEALVLLNDAFYGEEWEPIEGEFLELKFLLISSTSLEHWLADSIHFPRLKKLSLQGCWKLKEIPSGIGEISTLESVSLFFCRSSAVDSANQILMEQRDNGNDDFEVSINKLYKN